MIKTKKYLLLPALSVSLLLNACSENHPVANSSETQENNLEATSVLETSDENLEEANAHNDGIVHWSYDGDTGPNFWYSLDPEYAIAKEGKAQSPINIVTEECVSEGAPNNPVFLYSDTVFEVVNNGHTIQLDPLNSENKMELDGTVYTLKQAHFHSPSEHQVDGKNLEMELHIVHQDESENIAVLGLLITEGAENEVLKEVFEKLQAETTTKDDYMKLDQSVNLGELIEDGMTFFHYDGSLTTPPCAEGVQWVVCQSEVELSRNQINAFKEIYDGNNRPVQDINERTVYINIERNKMPPSR